MSKHVLRWMLALTLISTPAWAGIGDPVPSNPCPGAVPFADFLSVLEMNGGGCGGGFGMATAITCTLKQGAPAAAPADIAVEIYDEFTGASITGGPVCMAGGLAAGSTLTMVTNPIPGLATPFVGPVIPAPGGSCGANCFGRASARVFTTGRIECTATRIDLTEVCFFGAAAPAATKDLTVLRRAVQHGD